MRHFLLLVLSITASFTGTENPASAQAVLPEAQARLEVEIVYRRIMDEHPDPFLFHDQQIWEDRYEALMSRSGSISHVRQYFDLASLMSLAMDTHVQIYPEAETPGFETTYPLRFRLLGDGIYISAATDPYRDWVGYRVHAIGSVEATDIVDTLEDYAFSDNPARRRSWAVEQLLINPATYTHFGWRDADGLVTLDVEATDQTRHIVRLSQTTPQSFDAVLRSGLSQAYYWPAGWRTLDDLADTPVPLSRQRLGEPFWYTDLNGGEVVYLQFNTSVSGEGESHFVDFTLDMFRDLRSREMPPSRLIIDVRYNLGGWISRSLPLAYLAQMTENCCAPGSVILLTGPETISAGSVFAGVTELATRAIVIGQPTGGRPNIFIGQTGANLPYSNLYAEVSSEPYIGTDTTDSRAFIAPDIPVEERISDLIAGRDLALETALSVPEAELQTIYTPQSRLRPWTRTSQTEGSPVAESN